MEPYREKEEGLHGLLPALSLACGELVEPSKGPLNVFLQETVAFILVTCTRVNEINATFVFSFMAALCLCVSSEAGG
jgi:hypothetical protein